MPRAPVVYQPKILIVGQGRKRAYLGGEVYRYDAYNYLVLSVPLPAECETEASPEEPLLLARHQRRADDARRDDARDGRALAAGRPDAAGHLHDPDERGAGRGRHPAPRMPQVPARQPHARPPDGPRDRLSRAPRRAGRGPACPGQPGRPLLPDRPGPEARPRRVREAAQRRGAGEEGRDERRGLPPLLQARDGQLAAPVPQADPARPGEAAHGPRRLQREHRREGGRVREPVAVQPGVQAALRRDARRGGRADAGSSRGRLKPLRARPTGARPRRRSFRGSIPLLGVA